jgi:hypothetical protein
MGKGQVYYLAFVDQLKTRAPCFSAYTYAWQAKVDDAQRHQLFLPQLARKPDKVSGLILIQLSAMTESVDARVDSS